MAKNELTTTQALTEIQKVADETSIAKLDGMPQFSKAITLAKGMKRLKQLIAGEILEDIVDLMDTNLGFRTDRAPGTKDKAGNQVKPYPDTVVRDCAIEALLRGANPIGNEFNILVGKCYLTKEYYERMVRDLVQDLRVTEGVPQLSKGGNGALVSMRAEWVYNGRRDRLDCVQTEKEDTRIPVRVNAGMGTDAIIGKAYRKLYAKIHRRVTGSTWLEESTGDVIDAEPSVAIEVLDEPDDAVAEIVPEDELETGTAESTSSDNPLFKGIEQVLDGLENLQDVTDFETHAVQVCETDNDKALLQQWCDWRREQIRATRGPRSNGK